MLTKFTKLKQSRYLPATPCSVSLLHPFNQTFSRLLKLTLFSKSNTDTLVKLMFNCLRVAQVKDRITAMLKEEIFLHPDNSRFVNPSSFDSQINTCLRVILVLFNTNFFRLLPQLFNILLNPKSDREHSDNINDSI